MTSRARENSELKKLVRLSRGTKGNPYVEIVFLETNSNKIFEFRRYFRSAVLSFISEVPINSGEVAYPS